MSGQKYFETELDREAREVQRVTAELEQEARRSRQCATALATAAGIEKQIESNLRDAKQHLASLTDNALFAERLKTFITAGNDLHSSLSEARSALMEIESLQSDSGTARQNLGRIKELRGRLERLSNGLESLSALALSKSEDLDERLSQENRSAEYRTRSRVRSKLAGLSGEITSRLGHGSSPSLKCVESQSRELLDEVEGLSSSSEPTEQQFDACKNKLGLLVSLAEEQEARRRECETTARLIQQAFEEAGFAPDPVVSLSEGDASIRQCFEKDNLDTHSRVNTEVETGPGGHPVVWANMQGYSGGGEMCFVPEAHGSGNLVEIVRAAERLGLKIRPFHPNPDGTFTAIPLPRTVESQKSNYIEEETGNSRAIGGKSE